MGLPASETVSLSLDFKTGDIVIANGGTHKGKTGTIQSVTDKTCRLKLEKVEKIRRNIPLESVSLFNESNEQGSTKSFETGDIVKVNGGTHKGNTGTIQSLTDKTCRLKLENDGKITGNILLESISFFKKIDGSTRNFEIGNIVLVNAGTHKGKGGTIQSLTDKTCRLKLANDGKITGNIPIRSISFFTCKIEDKNNNKANGQIRSSE